MLYVANILVSVPIDCSVFICTTLIRIGQFDNPYTDEFIDWIAMNVSSAPGIEMVGIVKQQPSRTRSSSTTGSVDTEKQPYNYQQMIQLSLCLPGLEPLIGLDQVFVHQAVNIREIFSNVPNDFEVLTSSGQRIFKITEATGKVARNLGGGHQNFELNFCNANGQTIIRVHGQPGFYGGRACVSVLYENGDYEQKLGEVVQVGSGCGLEYLVKDAFGNSVFRIKGPRFGDCCCGLGMIGSVAFTVVSLDGKTVLGGIGKLWGGIAREIFTMADNYGLNFPADLDVTTKVVLLGSVIMLDFQFFERQ